MTATPMLPEPTPWPPWDSTGLRDAAYAALWDLPGSFRIGEKPQSGQVMTVADLKASLDARTAPPGFVLHLLHQRGLLLQSSYGAGDQP